MSASAYVLIAAAVDGELAGLRRRMNAWVEDEIGRRPVARGRLLGVPVRLMVTGPGTANTVQALTAVLEHIPPHLILLTGCAGAFRQSGLGIGDVGVADEEIDAHLGLEPMRAGDPPEALPFPVITVDGVPVKGRYPLSRGWAKTAVDALLRAADEVSGSSPAGIRVMRGPFLTVSTITATDRGAEAHYRHHGACMEAMEGSGAAHVACRYGVDLLEVRAASNLVGRRRRDAWNLDLAFERATWAVLTILDRCGPLMLEKMP